MIKHYLNENNEMLWEIYISIRGKNSSLRIQKRLKNIKTEALAKKLELQLLRDCERELVAKESRGMTWYELLEKFELHLRKDIPLKISALSVSDYMATIRKHTQSWVKRDANGINTADVRELYLKAQDELSLAQKMRIKMILNKIFNFGLEYNLIKFPYLPTAGIRFEREAEKAPEILTMIEIKKLLQSAQQINHPWYPVWALALLTGMRNGEIYALTWSDIDFENSMINLSKSYNKRLRITKSTKSGYWRNIPISSELKVLLMELKLNSVGRDYVLPRLRDWSNGYQAQVLRNFCKSVGVPSIRFHALRACFATQLLRQGIPAPQIQKICGWRDLKTMQRYIRLSGIEVAGVTENLKLLPDREVMGKVVNLFAPKG